MVGLDRTNARIIELLQKDARISISELARTLNRAESTTRERVAALEKAGFIQGYRADVDPAKLGYKIQALIRADCDMLLLREIAPKLKAIPNVISAHVTTGHKPIRIEVLADDLTKLEEIISKRISPLPLRDVEIGLVVQRLVGSRSPMVRVEGEPVLTPLALLPEAAPTTSFEQPLVTRPRTVDF